MGMGITTLHYHLVQLQQDQAIYDVNKEELDAMRRYVADWSKNSQSYTYLEMMKVNYNT